MEFRPCWEPRTENDSGTCPPGEHDYECPACILMNWCVCTVPSSVTKSLAGCTCMFKSACPRICTSPLIPGCADQLQCLEPHLVGRWLTGWWLAWSLWTQGGISLHWLEGTFFFAVSTFWQKLQNVPCSKRDPKNVEATRLALRVFQGIVRSAATCWQKIRYIRSNQILHGVELIVIKAVHRSRDLSERHHPSSPYNNWGSSRSMSEWMTPPVVLVRSFP